MSDDQLIKLPPERPKPKKKVKLDTLLKPARIPGKSKRSWGGKFRKLLRAPRSKSAQSSPKLKRSSSHKIKVKKAPKYNLIFATMAIIGLGMLIFIKPHPQSEEKPQTLSAETSIDTQTLSGNVRPEGTPQGFDIINPNTTDMADIIQTYDAEKGIVTFQDTLAGNPIKLTEQELPEDLRSDSHGIKNLALSILGKMMITQLVADFGPVYLVDLQNGSQNVIFAMGELLIFVTSDQPIAVETWLSYINSLE